MTEIAAPASPPYPRRRVIAGALSRAHQLLLAPGRFLWTVYFCALAYDEFERLTDADFRDMPFERPDGRGVAWQEARRRVGEVPQVRLLVTTSLVIAAAAMIVAAHFLRR
jgi:hypothetical protein